VRITRTPLAVAAAIRYQLQPTGIAERSRRAVINAVVVIAGRTWPIRTPAPRFFLAR
jgi:hypothetical protein